MGERTEFYWGTVRIYQQPCSRGSEFQTDGRRGLLRALMFFRVELFFLSVRPAGLILPEG